MTLPDVFRLEKWFEVYEHLPGMYVLGSSDAKTRTIQNVLSLDGGNLDLGSLTLSYPEVGGNATLRETVASMYAGVTPEQVLITIGATEAIFLALHTLLGEGDTALVCHPAFQALPEMARHAGARVISYNYEERSNFQPDLNAVRAQLQRPNPPAVLILNTPHNPTGQVLTAETLRNILDEAAAVGTTAVVDEVFSGIWHDSTPPVPSAAVLNPRAVVIGSLSKVYGLSGLRVGWLVGPADFIQACKRWRHYTSNCQPAIVQEIACVALRQRETLLRQSQQIADANYQYALEWLQRYAQFFTWVKPQGGLVMLLRLQTSIPAAEFSKELAEKHHVLLIPCTTCFGMPEGYLRLGLGGDPDRFREGLNRVSAYLRRVG